MHEKIEDNKDSRPALPRRRELMILLFIFIFLGIRHAYAALLLFPLFYPLFFS